MKRDSTKARNGLIICETRYGNEKAVPTRTQKGKKFAKPRKAPEERI